VIPQTATIAGTVRTMKRETMTMVETGMRRIAEGVAAGFGASASVDFRLIFAPLVNDPAQVEAIIETAVELVGEEQVARNKRPAMASEDFSFMMEKVPGAYINLGNGENSAPVHNPAYDFNDETIPFGVALWARLVERKLPRGE
jgi:hippurate hydrolase